MIDVTSSGSSCVCPRVNVSRARHVKTGRLLYFIDEAFISLTAVKGVVVNSSNITFTSQVSLRVSVK